MMGALLYPHAPRWLDVFGRVGFILTTAVYWWVLNVLSDSFTGTLLYPLLFIGLALEALPSFRQRSPCSAASSARRRGLRRGHGGRARAVPFAVYAYLAPLLGPRASSSRPRAWRCCCRWASWRPWLPRAVMGMLAMPYALLAWALGRGQLWTGMAVYFILTLGCVAEAAGLAPVRPAHRGLEAAARPGLRGAGAAAVAGRRGLVPRPARHRGAGARGHRAHRHRRGGLPAARPGGRARVAPACCWTRPASARPSTRGEPGQLEPYLRNLVRAPAPFERRLRRGGGWPRLASYQAPGRARPAAAAPGGLLRALHHPGPSPRVALALPFDEDARPRHGHAGGAAVPGAAVGGLHPRRARFRVQVLDQHGLQLSATPAPRTPR